MALFTDAKGRDWLLNFTIADRDLIKDAVGLDFYSLLDDQAKDLLELFSNLGRFAEVLWAAVAEDAEAKQIDAKAFCKGLTGPVLGAAKIAFEEALLDFFQSDPETQTAIRSILAADKRVTSKALERMREKMAKAESEAIDQVLQEIESIPLNVAFGKSADASA